MGMPSAGKPEVPQAAPGVKLPNRQFMPYIATMPPENMPLKSGFRKLRPQPSENPVFRQRPEPLVRKGDYTAKWISSGLLTNPEWAKNGSSNSKGVLRGAFFDQVTFLLSFEESSMHPQDHDCSIIRLTSSRKFVHRCEDRVDHVVSALFTAFGRCPLEALYSPLLVGRIYRFNDPVSVGEDQVARIKLNRAFLIGPIRKHSDGGAAGFKPNNRAVGSYEHRRIVACIHISQRTRCSIENAIK